MTLRELRGRRKAIKDYVNSISKKPRGMFSLSYQWKDKPHRHLYDVAKIARQTLDELEWLLRQKEVRKLLEREAK